MANVVLTLQLKRHTVTVLKNNNINVILDISYGDDNVNSVSQRIKVVSSLDE